MQRSLVREIQLTQGQIAIVDDEDYDALNAFKWYAWWSKYTETFYAVRNTPLGGGKWGRLHMHRFVTSAPEDMHVDHINKNTLDNSKENLRVCPASENQRNRGKQQNNTSGFKGVYFHKACNKWCARIGIENKKLHLGLFTDILEAARAYDKAALELHGAFARTNFPVST